MRKINLTIKELCGIIEGSSTLDNSFLIKNISSLEKASNSDLAVVFDPEDNSVFAPLAVEKIKNSKAAIILSSKKVVDGKNYLIVKDPLAAIEKIDNFLISKKYKRTDLIHKRSYVADFAVVEDNVSVDPFAVIEDDAKIGCGSNIGANSFIGKGAQIGCNVTIHPGAKVLDRCIVGDNSIIHSGAVIGSDGFGYRVMKTGLRKVPHIGIVRIGRFVEIGANTCIDRSEFDETVIGDGVKMDNNVHIAHNVKVGPGTAILAHTGIAGSAVIGAGCQIGGLVAIRDHIVIGNYVKIVSKSAVMKNVSDGEVICGIPSVKFSEWKRIMVCMNKLPEAFKYLKGIKKYIEERKKRGFFSRLFRG